MNLEFKDPWEMMWLENAGDWIDLVKKSLDPSDPLYGKKIFVSGIHESKTLLLIENDTDNNYAVVSIESNQSMKKYICKTIEEISSRENISIKLEQDHKQWLEQFV